MPREQLETAIEAARAAGWTPDVADLAGEDPHAPPGPDLRLEIDAERRRALRRLAWLGGLGLGVPAAVAAAWLIWTVAVHWATVSELRDQVAAARSATAPVASLQAEIRALEEAGSYLGAQRRATPYVTTLIEAVTRAMPDSAWLTELSLDQGTLRLGGFADDSAGLIPALSALPQLDAVGFAAPSVRDPDRRQDRFVVTATQISAGGARP
jgi:general secretion pathway protein L